MNTAFPFAAALAATVWIFGGRVSAEAPAPSSVRPRVTVKSIPPFSPDGQSSTVAPQTSPPSTTTPAMIPGHPMPPPIGPPLAEGLLSWDGDTKESTVIFGAAQSSFAFLVSNISLGPITITSVHSTCGCTIAKLPAIPWTLDPGTKGTIDIVMNLAGKQGINIKHLTIITDRGLKTLTVRTDIKDPPARTMNEEERARNLLIASANRQAVLHGACAACHSAPAVNKMGADLYQAACTICHEAEHRAASVPDLKTLQKDTTADYWRAWITSSSDGKLMPAFSIDHGGILTTVQIESLVSYLVEVQSQSSRERQVTPANAEQSPPEAKAED